jgi:hypothetical protein
VYNVHTLNYTHTKFTQNHAQNYPLTFTPYLTLFLNTDHTKNALTYAHNLTLTYAHHFTLTYALNLTLTYAHNFTMTYAHNLTLTYAHNLTLTYALNLTLTYLHNRVFQITDIY